MKKNSLRCVKVLMMLFAAVMFFTCMGATCLAYAKTEGEVTVDIAKIRSAADTSSSVQGILEKGAKVTIVDETKDNAGTVWYQIEASGAKGYVRSDLLKKGKSLEQEETQQTQTTTTSNATQTAVSSEMTPMAAQYAQLSVESGKMRSNASTNDNIVTTLKKGEQVVIDGQKAGGDGKTWYHVTYTAGDGSAAEGYIRSDLLTLGEMVAEQAPEQTEVTEAPIEEEAAQPEIPKDYEAIYADDGTGNSIWYLYDHKNNSRLKIEELLGYVDASAERETNAESSAKKLKVAVVILIVLLVLAIAGIVFLILRLRDYMYEDYEEYDEEEDVVLEPEEQPVVAPKTVKEQTRKQPVQNEVIEEETVKVAETDKPKKKKNVMIDDDDFSFEFLNLD